MSESRKYSSDLHILYKLMKESNKNFGRCYKRIDVKDMTNIEFLTTFGKILYDYFCILTAGVLYKRIQKKFKYTWCYIYNQQVLAISGSTRSGKKLEII